MKPEDSQNYTTKAHYEYIFYKIHKTLVEYEQC